MENAAAVLGFGIAWLFFSNWACNILKIATKEKSPDTFIRVGLKFLVIDFRISRSYVCHVLGKFAKIFWLRSGWLA